MIRRFFDRLTRVEFHVTDADVGADAETVWVTGYRRRWPHCVSLLMSHEDAALLGDMLPDVTGETQRTTPIERPEMTVFDVLDYWNGTTQFLARYVEMVCENDQKIYRLIYGCVTEECDKHLDSDDPRTYNLWTLPPTGEPQWQISEDELVYEKSESALSMEDPA